MLCFRKFFEALIRKKVPSTLGQKSFCAQFFPSDFHICFNLPQTKVFFVTVFWSVERIHFYFVYSDWNRFRYEHVQSSWKREVANTISPVLPWDHRCLSAALSVGLNICFVERCYEWLIRVCCSFIIRPFRIILLSHLVSWSGHMSCP